MNDFWYFGRVSESDGGHFLYSKFTPHIRLHGDDPRMGFPMWLLDCTFAPIRQHPGNFRLITIKARNDHLTILAGWDNTIDTRPGSNAAFISHGVLSADEMLARAKAIFPEQHKRLFENPAQAFWMVDL